MLQNVYSEKEIADSLPVFLGRLRRRLEHTKSPAYKPQVSHLLDMDSPDLAMAEFELIYYQHHHEKNSGDLKKTAESLGFSSPETLRTRIRRAERKRQEISGASD